MTMSGPIAPAPRRLRSWLGGGVFGDAGVRSPASTPEIVSWSADRSGVDLAPLVLTPLLDPLTPVVIYVNKRVRIASTADHRPGCDHPDDTSEFVLDAQLFDVAGTVPVTLGNDCSSSP